MTQLFLKLKKFFQQRQYSRLEMYVNAGCPSSVADVERLTQDYNRSYVWGRAL
jgi:hypothetical protein